MKHLLIILSFLLLSSPVIGQETGVLYRYESSSGFVWKTFGKAKVQPKYEGEIKNGIMDGFGVLIYPYDGKSIVGEWRNGKEWYTKHTNKKGKLLGNYVKGKQKLILFRIHVKEGHFWFVDSDEGKHMKYVGEVENGKPNGWGTCTWSDEYSYVGEWKDGEYHGQGTLTFPEEIYVGQFKNGSRYGQGTNTTYKGEWKGTKEVGQYKGNVLYKGTITYPDGKKLVGEFKSGRYWNLTEYDKNGNIIVKFVNGKQIKP